MKQKKFYISRQKRFKNSVLSVANRNKSVTVKVEMI